MNKSSALLAIIVTALVAFCAGRYLHRVEQPSIASVPRQPKNGVSRTSVTVHKVAQYVTPLPENQEVINNTVVPQVEQKRPPRPVTRPSESPPPPPPPEAIPEQVYPDRTADRKLPTRKIVPVPVPRPVDVMPLRFTATAGSRVLISGTSTLKDWSVESKVISGLVEIVPAPKADELPKRIYTSMTARIPVRSFTSANHRIKADNTMFIGAVQGVLAAARFPEIQYRCLDLTVTNYSETGVWQCLSIGNVIAHGTTNQVEIPIEIVPYENTVLEFRIQIKGETKLKMSTFNIVSPRARLNEGSLVPDDEVTVAINWELSSKR